MGFCCSRSSLFAHRVRTINQFVLVAPSENRVSVLRSNINVCGLLGHRRDKRQIRPFQETFRTKCLRCDVPLKRVASGKWTVIAASEVSLECLRPVQRNTVTPFVRASRADPLKDADGQRLGHQDPTRQDRDKALAQKQISESDRRAAFVARAEEATVLAQRASDNRTKVIHLEMATLYYSLAISQRDQPSPFPAEDDVRRIA